MAAIGNAVNTNTWPAREVRTDRETVRGPGYGAVSRRRFDAPIEDMWQLFADPRRLRLWYPDRVTGELRPGGKFSIENNASGEVLRCEPPMLFRVSWIYQDSYSELEVRLDARAGGTAVAIEHLMRKADLAGAGMSVRDGLVAAGTGWDAALDYLARYLRGELDAPPAAQRDWKATTAGVELLSKSERFWQEFVNENLEAGR